MANAVIVSPDYHRAPENKFPAAPDDAYATYSWVLEHAKEINGDPLRVAVGGESAGGNLATVVSMMARDKKAKMPLHQLLVYPVVSDDMTRPSYMTNANAKPLNKPMMAWFFKHYGADPSSPSALPIKAASLKGLPPATIIAAEIDPLLSEGVGIRRQAAQRWRDGHLQGIQGRDPRVFRHGRRGAAGERCRDDGGRSAKESFCRQEVS